MLVSCAVYHNGRKLRDIHIEEIGSYVDKPDHFVWVVLEEPDSKELKQMQRQFCLHKLAVEDAQHGHQRPKIEEYSDSLFIVLKLVEIDTKGSLNVGELDIFVGQNYILSVRTKIHHDFQAVQVHCEHEPHLLRNGPGFVLYALMDSVVDRYFPVLQNLETKLESVEDRIFRKTHAKDARLIIKELYSLKRQLLVLQHATTPLLEVVSKLYGAHVPKICQGMEDYFRDVYDHLHRMNKTIESNREMINTALEVNLGMINLSENEVMKKFGGYAALFAVPSMIAGIYGMNFQFMPELKWKLGYPLIILIMIIVDIFLWRQFKKRGWL